MPAGSSSKRERQYEHIKESYEKRGQKGRAKEIAARTVNKERAEAGEAKGSARTGASSGGSRAGKSGTSRSRSSSNSSGGRSSGKSSSSRASASASGNARSGGERTRAQLYEEARRQGISGRSTMNKAQLERALSR